MDQILGFARREIGDVCYNNLFADLGMYDDNLSKAVAVIRSLMTIPAFFYSQAFNPSLFKHLSSSHRGVLSTCSKMIVSKMLSYAIIMGSVLVKLPQILKIRKAKSCAGLSIWSILIELVAITSTMVYGYAQNFAFSSWGDSLFMAIQTFLIANLYFYYGTASGKRKGGTNSGSLSKCLLFSAFYAAIVGILMAPAGYVPKHMVSAMQVFNLPIIFFSKAIQIFTNFKNGYTGQLSFLSFMLMTLGSMARIFTSIQETGDVLVILPFCISSVLNSIIIFQIIYYKLKPTRLISTYKTLTSKQNGKSSYGKSNQNNSNTKLKTK